MANQRGSVGAQSSIRTWQMDDVTFTYVVDGAMSMDPGAFLPDVPAQYWAAHPDHLDAHRRVPMSAGGLLVQRGDHRLLIDAGFGDVHTDASFGRVDSGALLQSLAAAGVTAAEIDVLALTHLHVDHTGWLFTPTPDGEVVPTFAKATYVVSDAEWAPYVCGEEPAEMPDRRSVIEPLRRHQKLRTVGDGEVVAPGVTTLVTPGHSSGHASYVVTSNTGRRLVAFGDVFHVPAQLSHQHWGSAPDADPRAVPAARRVVTAELLAPETTGFAIHFGDQPFGVVRRDQDATPRWHPMASTELAPPPWV